jgi:hypothetical protein
MSLAKWNPTTLPRPIGFLPLRSADRTSQGLMPQDLPRITHRLQTPPLLSSQGERSNSPEYQFVRRNQIGIVPAQPLVGGSTTVSTHLQRESVASQVRAA